MDLYKLNGQSQVEVSEGSCDHAILSASGS